MLLAKLSTVLAEHLSTAETAWVAYSGGLDSTVLLRLVSELRERLSCNIKALHIHHGLSPYADEWQAHCKAICMGWNIPLHIIKVNARHEQGQSPEAAARNARYQAFQSILQKNDFLLTAHHQDDQAETLLLQLLRGAGVKGLAAMPVCNRLGMGQLLRPMLSFTREELLIYAKRQNLTWIDDESNTNERFDRNFVRQQLMPIITRRWPMAAKVISRSAQHCAEAAMLLTDLAIEDFAAVNEAASNILSINKIKTLSISRQRNVIRHWLSSLQLSIPNAKHMQQILTTVINSADDAMPAVKWDNVLIRRYRDGLYAMSQCAVNESRALEWDCSKTLKLPNNLGTLHCDFVIGLGIKKEYLTKSLTVRFRQGGERCHPIGRTGSHPLKKLFQEWGVPPWQREQIPLLYHDEQLIAVVGYCICKGYAVRADEEGGVITLI